MQGCGWWATQWWVGTGGQGEWEAGGWRCEEHQDLFQLSTDFSGETWRVVQGVEESRGVLAWRWSQHFASGVGWSEADGATEGQSGAAGASFVQQWCESQGWYEDNHADVREEPNYPPVGQTQGGSAQEEADAAEEISGWEPGILCDPRFHLPHPIAYTGHLLDNAKLTRKDKVMVKTRAGSDYEEDITNAMIELAPELEGESGYPIGSSEPNVAARQGDEFLLQRSEHHGGRFGNRKENKDTYAMDLDGPIWEEPSEMQDEVGTMMDGEEEQEIPELAQAEHDAMVMHHKAKQRIAEIRKLRQYFKRPDPEERKRLLAEKMKTAPCHRCGELGHWSRECPQKVNAESLHHGRALCAVLQQKMTGRQW